MVLETVSANMVYDGILTKYKFKVRSLSLASRFTLRHDDRDSRAQHWAV